VAAGDFNHDGILDLAVTVARPSSDGSFMVFLGKGDGTFLPPISSNAPGAIWSLVMGDFNKDGQADLAAINTATDFQADQVVVFLGQGDGTFASAKTYAAGIGATSLAVGDFNQDGFADIAIADLGSFTGAGIDLLLGKGDGTFSQGAYIAFPEGGGPESVAAADLNGDGKLDLVAGVRSRGAAILLGNGDGTFLPPITYPANVASAAVGDINGDGIPDVVLSSASVLIGNGDGTFQLQTLDLPLLTGPLIAADFNGHGKLDMASVFGFPGEGPAIFLNLSHPTALLSVVSAADFSQGPLAPHSIASAFGKHLALSTASATPPALPTTLGGATVSVQDQAGAVGQAEIYYASPGQVNFVLPPGLETGAGIVTIRTADGQSASTEIQIAPVAPTLFILEPSGIPVGYAVQVSADNVQTIEPIFTEQGGIVQEVPIDVSTGDVYLVLFGTGFDTTSFGAEVEIGNVDESANYVGPQNQFPGLDQINFLVPKSLAGRGSTPVLLSFVTSEVNFYITIK
jgi:uncharacterized protein (TIGR03437 family)